MKATLSAIKLGAILACACSAAFAGPTVTTTQQGSANTAHTEQVVVDQLALTTTATIVQIGNNNVAGDPLAHIPGIFQREADGASATIDQRGDKNSASIIQDGTKLPVPTQIRQEGSTNTAAITQHIVTWSDASLTQTGAGNEARLEQSQVADLGFQGTQYGTDNYLSFRQHGAVYGSPIITQTGSGNSVWVDQDHVLYSGGTTIEQNGNMNAATSTLQDVQDAIDSILQIGTGNTAITTQKSSSRVVSVIVQNGDGNLATLTQEMGTDNNSLISQAGNDNMATVLQTGMGNGGNSADIRQVGDGFVADITQSGANNSAGVYQH